MFNAIEWPRVELRLTEYRVNPCFDGPRWRAPTAPDFSSSVRQGGSATGPRRAAGTAVYTGVQRRAPFDPAVIGFARLARAPHVLHVLHAVLDAGQLSRLQLALASLPPKRDSGCRGEWALFNGADW